MAEERKVLLRVRNLKKHFPLKKRSVFQKDQLFVKANDGITLDIYEGETLGLVGESGCGKSTFGRTILQLYEQTDGSTLYYGRSVAEFAPEYVKDVIKGLAQDFPKYLNDKKEVDKIRVALANEKDDMEHSRVQEKLDKAVKALENTYKNMFRIAGGLLTHNQLGEVSKLLLALHEARMKAANINRKMMETEAKKTNPKLAQNASQLAKIDAQVESLKADLEKASQAVAEAEAKVEALRNQCVSNPNFNLYEEQVDTGIDLSRLTKEEVRVLRRDLQIIFQDPYSSLNPRMTVGQIIGEGLLAHNYFKSPNSKEYTEYITDIMDKCGLAPYFIHRYPHQFSGGQRQRIGIARALALNPQFIVCDEAVSALDVSIQSQIINLLIDLKNENNLTYLFITHDLSVVKFISDRIGVMYLGNMVELASSDQIFANPLHPYTEALMEAIPRTDVDANQELSILEGDIPSPIKPPKGCKFHTRCKYAFDKCYEVEPTWQEIEPGHFVACHLRGE